MNLQSVKLEICMECKIINDILKHQNNFNYYFNPIFQFFAKSSVMQQFLLIPLIGKLYSRNIYIIFNL